ncbi:MAG: trypsin-like peptidase domain-containing protein [Oscillospiraceae bacterium]|nr:trypsin-like peptidase domain-containing protein [Oscillospiraceae bacterium]
MFEHDDDFGKTQELDSLLSGGTPAADETPVYPQQDPAPQVPPQPQTPLQNSQPAGGSYYSPRSGGGYPSGGYPGGGNVPPVNDNFRNDAEAPKKKSHKGLKALAVFASVAFIAYASIQLHQYAMGNDKIRSFLGKQDNTVTEQENEENGTEDEQADTKDSAAGKEEKTDSKDSSSAKPMSFIELAAREDAMSIPDIVDKITPATVGVASTFVMKGQTYSTFDPFSFFGFDQGSTPDQDVPATGTGIIMSDNGDGTYYIITNAHVINDTSQYKMGRAKSVQIVLNPDYYDDDTRIDAEIVGFDAPEDIAVLKITTDQKLTVAEFGDSNDLRVGELVVAIGNPLGFELFGSVTTGIVSALDREVEINDQKMKLIQTDTAINSGNSGGPLINCYGQVIGINSSKISSSYYSGEASVEGLCFAIPITHAQDIINQLINYGYVVGKPLIGITPYDLDEITAERLNCPVGVYVRDVEDGSPADLAGISTGDIIIAVDGQTVRNYEELKAERDKHQAGDRITLTIYRRGEDVEVPLILQERKASTQQ